MLINSGYRQQQPASNVTINYGHPLAHKLRYVAMYTGHPSGGRDLVTGQQGTLGANTVWRQTERGMALEYNTAATSVGSTFLASDTYNDIPNYVSEGATISAWIWMGWGSIAYGPCFLSMRNAGAATFSVHIGNTAGETNILKCYNGVVKTITFPTSFSKNAWHHVAVVFNRVPATNTMYAYVDGVLQGSVAQQPSSFTGRPMNIGSALDTLSEVWQGYIHMPMVWNRPFTDDQVRWLYEDPYAIFNTPKIKRTIFLGRGSSIINPSSSYIARYHRHHFGG